MKQTYKNTDNQLVISHELLRLLDWLIENEQETLKKLIIKALKSGHAVCMPRESRANDQVTAETAHDNIITFLELMDLLLAEVAQEYDETTYRLTRFNHPALDHIDSSLCDADTIHKSVAYATKCTNKNTKMTQDMLLKDLLKRWKPAKKTVIN